MVNACCQTPGGTSAETDEPRDLRKSAVDTTIWASDSMEVYFDLLKFIVDNSFSQLYVPPTRHMTSLNILDSSDKEG